MRNIRSHFLNFAFNNQGIAAVEFALILPIMMVLAFGSFATFETVQHSRHVERTSSIIADLTSRLNVIDDDIAKNFVEISKSLIGDAANDDSYEIVFSSVSNTFDTDGKYDLKIDWSFANKDSAKLKESQLDKLNIPFVPEGESVVLVNVELDYSTTIFQDFIGVISLDQFSSRRPRFVPLVVYSK